MDATAGLGESIRSLTAAAIARAFRILVTALRAGAAASADAAENQYGPRDPVCRVYRDIDAQLATVTTQMQVTSQDVEAQVLNDVHHAAEYVADLTASFTSNGTVQSYAQSASKAAIGLAFKTSRAMGDTFAAFGKAAGVEEETVRKLQRSPPARHVTLPHIWRRQARATAFRIRFFCCGI